MSRRKTQKTDNTRSRSSSSSEEKIPKKLTATYIQNERDGNVLKGFVTFKKIVLTENQNKFYDTIKENKITVCTGDPGTSKTFVSCYAAMKLFATGEYDKIIITKPIETSGEEIGALRGDLNAKIEPFIVSYIDNFANILEGKDLKALWDDKKIEFVPIAYMRGRTFQKSIIIVDESQNMDLKQIMLVVTRLHKDSKMVLVGDENQNDINKAFLALNIFKDMIKDIEGVGTHEFTRSDIVRDPILIEITDRYEALKNKPQNKNKT